MRPPELYAVIDLGSNSFHMLITRLVADSVQIVDKVKRKVRLASGLDSENKLDQQSFTRGLECLSFFAERLQDIPQENIRIVATATLRIATNADDFIAQANHVLKKKPVELLSGDQEAERIYLGVAHTSSCPDKRLVIDIGGASTEIIVGHGFDSLKVKSIDMGCVTFNQAFFPQKVISAHSFELAVEHAKTLLSPYRQPYQSIGWQTALSGSGTMQALAEILLHQRKPAIVQRDFLFNMQEKIKQCDHFSTLNIAGLSQERTPVFVSGIAILWAIFDVFDIEQIQLSSGALREGLLYEMLPDMRKTSIRQRTINSLTERFHIDTEHANRVSHQATLLYELCSPFNGMSKNNNFQLLLASCALHETGLLLSYKRHHTHGAYIVKNADIPGFDQTDKQLLTMLVGLSRADIDNAFISLQSAASDHDACWLLMILRLAIIFCRGRLDDTLTAISVDFDAKQLTLKLPNEWLTCHTLIVDELHQENDYWQALGYSLTIQPTH